MNAKMFSLLLLQTVFAFLVQATLYITAPLPATVCTGGKACTVEWVDDGVSPLLADIGACHVALYNGQEKLIQQLDPVDVSAQHGLQFTPDPKAGPDSSTYYINFTSVDPVDGATFHEFSTFFTITSMTGSFNSPVSSDASPVPVPSTLTASHSSSSISTITVGASSSSSVSTSVTSPASSSSSFSSASSSSSSSSSFSSSRSASSSGSAASTSSSSVNTSASGFASSSPSSTASSSSSASTSSGFVTSFNGPVTTLVVPAPSSLGSAASTTTAPPAPSSSTSSTTENNQTSSAFRTSTTPLFLFSLVALAFGLLM